MRFPARCAWFAAAAAAAGGEALYSSSSSPHPATPPKTLFRATAADGPAPAPPWVILGSIPRVAQDGGGAGAGEADVSLTLAAPPRVTRLTVRARLPGPPHAAELPVRAVDRSGLLLLSAILATPLRRVVVDRPGMHSVHCEDTNPRYYVLDAATGAASYIVIQILVGDCRNLGLAH